MNMNLNQLVILGGGYSARDAINLGLFDEINNYFSFGLNYAYQFVNTTANIYVDKPLYTSNINTKIFQELPLIIGQPNNEVKKLPNTIWLNATKNHLKSSYDKTLKNGVYNSHMCGIFAVSLGIYLLEKGEIFLLGFDNGSIQKDKNGKLLTHWYQGWDDFTPEKMKNSKNKKKYRGIGKENAYHSNINFNNPYSVYRENKNIKIYNVSPNSKLEEFEKITPEKMLQMLKSSQYTQEQIRCYIKNKLLNNLDHAK